MAKGLGRTLRQAISNDNLKGLHIRNQMDPLPQQLQFADGTLVMGHPSTLEASTLKSILHTFLLASSTIINQGKSLILFFNTPLVIQHNIIRILGFQKGSLPSKNLGAHLILNASRNISCEDLMSKFDLKLSSWPFRSLNLPGRVTLFKSVLQSMSLYLF
jgi:hypothetical protein